MSKHIQVTDDWHADEPMGYAVPTPNSDLGEYRVFVLLHDAKHFADRQEDDEGADIPIYPLWAGHPIDHSRDKFDEYSFEQPSEQSHAATQTEVAGLREENDATECAMSDEEAAHQETLQMLATAQLELTRLKSLSKYAAALADTGSQEHKLHFGDGKVTANGWRVAEMMREKLLSAIPQENQS